MFSHSPSPNVLIENSPGEVWFLREHVTYNAAVLNQHFKGILLLAKSMKTRLSKKFWVYFIFKYFLDNSLKK